MRIVVGGASGFIGSALVPALQAAGHDAVRLVRREPQSENEISWDPQADRIDAARLAGVDAAVILNGANVGRRWTGARKQEILESRVSSTTLLAQTLAGLDPRPGVMVCAGGVDVYGDRGDEILTEESDAGSGFLAEVGRAWEDAAKPAREAGIRVVTFRQGFVLSRSGGALARMLTPFKLGIAGRIGNGRQWWSWVELDDLLSAYRFALANEDISGPVNLSSPNPVTNAQFTRALGRTLKRPTITWLPALAVKAVYGQMGEETLLGSKRVLPARLLDAGFTFMHPDLEPALERILG